ncbi:hypothetical protein HDU83_004833 [Entophlyctis luteolus]|nr:hypothetical protein HDU83_004833 [Entophlyctis luteolus]
MNTQRGREFHFENTPINMGNRILIVRLASSLAVVNPVHLSPTTLAAVKSLEVAENLSVSHLLTTGDWHYMHMGEWLPHFPQAKCFVPPGRIQKKIAELETPYAYELLDPEVDNPLQVQLGPNLIMQTIFGMKQLGQNPQFAGHTVGKRIEYAFFHPASKSVIAGDSFWFADEKFPISSYYSAAEKGGIVFHFAKFACVGSIDGLKYSVAKILEWDFENFVPLHGLVDGFLRLNAKPAFSKTLNFLDVPPTDFQNDYPFILPKM